MLAGLTTAQLVLIGVAILIGLIWAGKNAGEVKDSIASFFGKVKAGDFKAALIDAISNSAIVTKAAEVKGEVQNCVSYIDMKRASTDVPEIVDATKAEEVKKAFETILTAIATSSVIPDQTVARRA